MIRYCLAGFSEAHFPATDLVLHALQMTCRAKDPHAVEHRIEQSEEHEAEVILIEQQTLRAAGAFSGGGAISAWIWHLYHALDTPREADACAPYLDVIGIRSWDEIIDNGPVRSKTKHEKRRSAVPAAIPTPEQAP